MLKFRIIRIRRLLMDDSFLLDEVRCGFMVPSAVKQAWAAQLEVLAEIDRVCRMHNIQYYAGWGTLLGTVRHGGFVPWDDDMDIVMKREDYNRFMTTARFDMEEGFDVQTFRNQKDFWLFMGKVVGKNRFCFERDHLRRFHNFPYIACVDVFVLDYVYRDPEREEKRRILCKYILGVADAIVEGRFMPGEKESSLETIEEMSGIRLKRLEDPIEMGRYLYGEVEKIFAEVPEDEADMLTQLFPLGLKGDSYHFPKEYYDCPIYLPFEYISMPVPVLYDKMLRKGYGDYLFLVKDAGAHDYPFFEGQKKNLQKVLDFELPGFKPDISKLYRSENEKLCIAQSYKAMAKECAEELWKIERQISAEINTAHEERAADMIQVSQQLAIDLGTLLEKMVGEDSAVVRLLEGYCEALYALYELTTQGNLYALTEIHQKIAGELEQNIFGRRTILFLPVLARDWAGLNDLWLKASEASSCDAYVAPLPYYYKDYDGSPKKICCDVADFPEELQAVDYKLLTPEYLEMLHPEVIIIQNPYDAWNPAISVPEGFYSLNLRKYTDELIYVPPFAVEEYSKENYREYFNMQYYVNMPGVVYADRVIVRSENMKRMYVEKLTEFAGENTGKIWKKRIAVMELPAMSMAEADLSVCDGKTIEKQNRKKRLLYGIGLGTYMEAPEAARDKILRNMQLFILCEEYLEVSVYIFPDGNSILNSVRSEIMDLLDDGISIIRLQDGQDVKDFDAYYGDPMPIVTEFVQEKKLVVIQDIRL